MRASVALLLLSASASVLSADLGTLFHSAAERERLDRLRRGEARDGPIAPAPDPVITGYVKRSDGKSTVFIDKQPVPVRNPRLERRLEPKVVERYEPLPMPPVPPDAENATSPPTVAGSPESKARVSPPATPQSPAPRRRADKDE